MTTVNFTSSTPVVTISQSAPVNAPVSERERMVNEVAQTTLTGTASSQVSTATTTTSTIAPSSRSSVIMRVDSSDDDSSDDEGGGTEDYRRNPREACTPGCGYTWSDLGCGY